MVVPWQICKFKRRVHLVESENSCDGDLLGPSEHKTGMNVARQTESYSASDIKIGLLSYV